MTKEMKERFEEKLNHYTHKVYFELTQMKRYESTNDWNTKAWNRANERRVMYLQMVRDLEDILGLTSEERWDYCKAKKEVDERY